MATDNVWDSYTQYDSTRRGHTHTMRDCSHFPVSGQFLPDDWALYHMCAKEIEFMHFRVGPVSVLETVYTRGGTEKPMDESDADKVE